MGYADLRRRDGRTRGRVAPPSPYPPSSTTPLLAVAAALGLVLACSVMTFLFEDSLLAIVIVLAFLVGAFLMHGKTGDPSARLRDRR